METGELCLYPAEMDLRRLLQDAVTVWSGQAETKRIAIATDLADCPQVIVADEVRLRQIVFNLMSNAIKFTDHGQVTLAGACEAGERLAIRVSDSGIGIPAGKLSEIFEPFKQVDSGTTRRHGGTGLGLAICRNLAQAMGGEVKVESRLGEGSTFTINVPLVRPAVEQSPVHASTPPSGLSASHMLVVEANPLSQGILRALLGPHVRDLAFVSDLDQAIVRLGAGGISHVLADGISIGLTISAAARLAEATRAVGAHCTLLWPAPDAELAAAIRAAGIVQLIAKPVAAPELLSAIRLVYDEEVAGCEMAA